MFKAKLVERGIDVAVKFLLCPKRRSSIQTEFQKAKKLPQKLFESKRIIHYVALCDTAPYGNANAQLIIMELADGGSLNDAIITPGESMEPVPRVLTPRLARSITIQIIEGLAHLHHHDFVHRDLKPDNLWFNRNGRLVIGDLGCIKVSLFFRCSSDACLIRSVCC